MLKYSLRAKTVMLSVVAVQECKQADDFLLYIELLRTFRVWHTRPSAFVKIA